MENVFFKELFTSGEHPWEALRSLKAFFSTYPLGDLSVGIPKGVTLVNSSEISIGEGTKIEAGAYIEGPCIIGKNCTVRHGAYLRPYSLIGDGVVVGHCTEIKHSILFPFAKAPHFNYVGDSIIGNAVNLGAGVICANMRHDKQEVLIMNDGKKYHSKLYKLGAIIGDGASLGCNCVLNPGTVINPGYQSMPCSNLKGVVSK